MLIRRAPITWPDNQVLNQAGDLGDEVIFMGIIDILQDLPAEPWGDVI